MTNKCEINPTTTTTKEDLDHLDLVLDQLNKTWLQTFEEDGTQQVRDDPE